uniref:ANF_receptor domain-containing protein n=1 Tax=Angiostrongylus cantonensis TaxID=6313 RepID=A0A0K0D4F0_ANGCA
CLISFFKYWFFLQIISRRSWTSTLSIPPVDCSPFTLGEIHCFQTLYDSPDVSTSIVHLLLATASENATIVDLLSRFGHGQGLLMKGGLHILQSPASHRYRTSSGHVGDTLQSSSACRVPEIHRFDLVLSYAPTGRAYYFTLTYLTPFWRGQGRSGQLIYTNSLGPIVWLTTFDVALPTMCDGTGATGVLWGIAHFSQQMTTSQRHAAYVDVVTRSLGDYGQLPLDTSDENFMSDPFCQGSIAILPPKFDVAGLRYIRGINHHGEVHIGFHNILFHNNEKTE